MKKIMSVSCAVLLCFAFTQAILPLATQAQATQKTADVYILAGQSNAVGCSNLDQDVYNGDGTYREYLTEEDDRNVNGYENILYYGAVNVSADATTLPNPDLQQVKMGLGQSSNYIGPELGLANAFAESTSDTVVIIKFAASGSFLGDYDGTFSSYYFTQTYGNWASPTTIERWTEEGKKIHANTGLLYNRLLSFTEQGLDKLSSLGYTASIKGYVWMQGESDSEDKTLAADYYENLSEFITDLRSDIAEICQDETAAYRPFVLGKITPTYNYPALGMSTMRENQEKVASALPYVYTVETDDMPMLDMSAKAYCGSDACHYNAKDMYELGQRLANSVLDHSAKYGYSVSASTGGSVEQVSYLSNGESVTIGYSAEDGYELVKVYLGDTDVTEEALKDGVVTLTPSEDVAFQTVTLEFGENSVAVEDVGEDDIEDEPFPWFIFLIAGGVLIVCAVVALTIVLIHKKRKS